MFFHQLWSKELKDPSGTRGMKKPRTKGLTLVIDEGIGLDSFSDLLQLHAGYVDYIKLDSCTATLYPPSILRKKSEAARLCQIELYADAKLLEVATSVNQVNKYFDSLHQLEIETIEIPCATEAVSQSKRLEMIREAKKEGFTIITMYKSDPTFSPTLLDAIEKQYHQDIDAGAALFSFVSYPGVWLLQSLKDRIPFSRIICPAEQKKQQALLLQNFGNEMNISDIPLNNAISLEAVRRSVFQKKLDWKV